MSVRNVSVRLCKAFGSTPETWLRMQMAYDFWQIGEREDQIEVEQGVGSGLSSLSLFTVP